MELLEFNRHRSCPKCSAFSTGFTLHYIARRGRDPEYLKKKCDECGYEWNEVPSTQEKLKV